MPSVLLDDSAIVERYLKLRRNESSEMKSLDVSELLKDDSNTRDLSFTRRESEDTGNSGLQRDMTRMEMVLLRDQETSVKLEYIKEAGSKEDTFSGIFIKNEDHEMNMEEIRKNFAEVFARQGATLTAIEERSTESDDEELECREFEDFYENGLNMYEETSKHSLKYSTSGGTLLTADSFLENNFIDISTMDGDDFIISRRVIKYFEKNWWLIYPEGRFRRLWDYIICIVVVLAGDSDVRGVRHTCADQLLPGQSELRLGRYRLDAGRHLLPRPHLQLLHSIHGRGEDDHVAVADSEELPEVLVRRGPAFGHPVRADPRRRQSLHAGAHQQAA